VASVRDCACAVCVGTAVRYVQDYDEKNPATYKGLNLHTMPMSALYAHFGLDAQTIDFIGHALALHRCASLIALCGHSRYGLQPAPPGDICRTSADLSLLGGTSTQQELGAWPCTVGPVGCSLLPLTVHGGACTAVCNAGMTTTWTSQPCPQ
jgi:hypothetical protein